MSKKEIHNKIRLLRETQGISQESIAYDLGLSQKSYSRIENGDTSLKLSHVEKIAKALQVQPSDLLNADTLVINIGKQVTKNIYGTQNGYIQTYSLSDIKDLQERVEKIEEAIEKLSRGFITKQMD